MNVVDSRFDPPRIVKQRDLTGSAASLAARGRRATGCYRYEIAVDVTGAEGETAYLLRVGPRAFQLELVRKVRGHDLSPRTFSQR